MNDFRTALKDIQRDTLRGLLIVAMVAAVLGVFATRRIDIVRFLFTMIFICLTVIGLQTRYMHLPNHFLVYSLWLLAVLALRLHVSPLMPYAFAVIALIAANLLNIFAASFVVLASSLALLLLGAGSLPVEPPLLMVWANFAVSLIFSRGLHQALRIVLDYQAYAVKQMDAARERRAELAQTAKALNDARDSLHHTNIQLRYARDAAEEARRLKAQFAANVSHELRTPINLIVGFSEVIALAPEAYKVPLPAAYRADILAVYRNAKHLQNLINDILDISQIEAERLAIVKEEIDPLQVINEAAHLVRESIENKGLRFVMILPEQLPAMWLDRTRIRQVILNLLANAARFTDQGTITLCASIEGEDLRMSVMDTGIGIPADELDRVFEEFYQVEGSLARKQGGTGLGLTLSKQFVEQHGGRMWAESDGALGQGSTFSFTLPIINIIYQTAHGHGAGIQHEKPGILVYDNDPAIVQLFRGYSRHHLVSGSQNAEECLRLVQNLHPTAVVLPGDENASDLTRRIHDLDEDVTVLVCPMPSGKRVMQAQGVADYLVKPISREGLLHALSSLGTAIQRVLIIDDEPDLMRLFTRMLQTAPQSYDIQYAYSGQEGLAAMRDQRPDVVLLDIQMPDIDGFTIIQRMHADSALYDIPVVVVSARGTADAIVQQAKGEISVIRPAGFKPIELVNAVEALVSSLHPVAQHM
ncbi:MAG: ATP-binding protein [Anaerolineae bacterium]